MKDIDFDELDRAVNSLMASVGESTPQADMSPQKPASVPVPQASTQTPSLSSRQEESIAPTPSPAAPASSPAIVRSAAPAARRSGRFMDMVHTSSSSKQRPETPPPAITPVPSREGISITPRDVEQKPAAFTSSAPEEVTVTDEINPFQSMPDPLDLMTPAEPAAEVAQPQQPPVSEPTASSTIQLGLQESPFLSDTKVEKRPLNSGSDSPRSDLGLSSTSFDAPADQSEPTISDDISDDEPPINPQIPELDSDLVAIESDKESERVQAVETSAAVSAVDVPSVPLGPSSIPQQYAQQPSSGDQSHAAIYDSSEYPQALAHPAKSKSGWLWVVWVLLLLGLGAGGAVLLYTLGIIP